MRSLAVRPGRSGESGEQDELERPARSWSARCREALVRLRDVRRLQDAAFGRIGPARISRDSLGGGTLGLAGSEWCELTQRLDQLLSTAAGTTADPSADSGEQPAAQDGSIGQHEFGSRGRDLSHRITELADRKFATNIAAPMREEFREAMRDLLSADQLVAMVNEFSAADVDACGQLREHLGAAVRSLREPREMPPAVRDMVPGREPRRYVEALDLLRIVIECQQAVIVRTREAMLDLLVQVGVALDALREGEAVGPLRAEPAIAGTAAAAARTLTGPGTELAKRVGLLDGSDPASAMSESAPGVDSGSYLGGDTVYAIWKSMDDALLRLEEEAVGECLRLDDVLLRLGVELAASEAGALG